MCRVTMGHLKVTVGHPRIAIGHLRVTIGHLRLTIGYFKAIVVHIRVTLGHLRVTTGCPVKLSALRFCYFLGFQSTYERTSSHFSIAQEIRISKLTLLSFLHEKLV